MSNYSTCQHCGRQITDSPGYWTHARVEHGTIETGMVLCDLAVKRSATPKETK